MKLAYPLNGGMLVRTAAWALWLEIHADRYNQDVPATLSSQERARLKARAHSLEPVVRMGHAGITPELVAEVDRALTAHGLIKVGIAVDDRDDRRALGDALAERVDGTPVHRVGKVLILWRPRPEGA
jgi:putative YhbY family RNA-binding protein